MFFKITAAWTDAAQRQALADALGDGAQHDELEEAVYLHGIVGDPAAALEPTRGRARKAAISVGIDPDSVRVEPDA